MAMKNERFIFTLDEMTFEHLKILSEWNSISMGSLVRLLINSEYMRHIILVNQMQNPNPLTKMMEVISV